ncbi:HD domain-containing protein [Streptomyces sp. NPDC048248]|uniref:HD domain-containing protein n=1 Tax=Streptomyces sp. NPDC048248 TaxID=3365523 RepID=UPI003714F260
MAEHSWHLAMVSWLLHQQFEREFGHALELERMLKMCLMRDLVEIEAGDPSAWATQHSAEHSHDKARIEEEVAQRRFTPLPGPLGTEFLDACNSRGSRSARPSPLCTKKSGTRPWSGGSFRRRPDPRAACLAPPARPPRGTDSKRARNLWPASTHGSTL